MDAYARDGGELEGFAQLSIEGRGGKVALSYLGNERLLFRCGARECSVRGPLAPLLGGVVEALVARRRAREAVDRDALGRLAREPVDLDAEAVRQTGSRRGALLRRLCAVRSGGWRSGWSTWTRKRCGRPARAPHGAGSCGWRRIPPSSARPIPTGGSAGCACSGPRTAGASRLDSLDPSP